MMSLKQFLLEFHNEGSNFMGINTLKMELVKSAFFVVYLRNELQGKFCTCLSVPEKVFNRFVGKLLVNAFPNELR